MKTILVTGGTGFIGRHLIPDLLGGGWRVEVLTRDMARARACLPDDVSVVDSLDRAGRPEAIVNLAGENLAAGRWTAARKREIRASRLRLTGDLVAFIGRCEPRPRVLISGSAVGFYGARGDTLLDESMAPADEFQSRLCSDWEAAALRARDEYGLRVCLIRTGIVLGRNEGALARMTTPFKLGLGGQFGSGRQYMPWIHIGDEIGAIRFLLAGSELAGPFNLTAPAPVTNREFTRTLARLLHRPALARVPGPVLKLMLGEMAHLLLSGQRAVPQALQAAGYTFAFSELAPALENLLEA